MGCRPETVKAGQTGASFREEAQGVEHRPAGNPDQAAKGLVQFQDEEDGASHRNELARERSRLQLERALGVVARGDSLDGPGQRLGPHILAGLIEHEITEVTETGYSSPLC